MKRSLLKFALISAMIVPATTAIADPNVPLDSKQDKAVANSVGTALQAESDKAGRDVLSAGSPNSRAGAGYNFSSLQFTSDGDDTSVSLALSFDLGTYRTDKSNSNQGDFYRVGRTKLGVVGSVPIDSKDGFSRLFAGDSLVSGSKLKLSVTHFSATLGSGGLSWKMLGLAYSRCVEDQRKPWLQSHAGAEADSANAFFERLESNLLNIDSETTYDTIFRAAAKAGEPGVTVTTACMPAQGRRFENQGDLIVSYGDDPEAFRASFIHGNARLTFWGIDASMGRDDHTYLDQAAFTLPSAARTSWEVGAYYGWINSDLTFSLRGRAVYGQTYEDNDEAEICRTVSIPAGTECIKGPDGAPLRQRSGLVSVEARKLVMINDGTRIAMAPQVTYRTEDKSVGVEVPIYLVPDKDGKLSGGIKAVYNSKGDEFAVGLFVGVPFSIFFN